MTSLSLPCYFNSNALDPILRFSGKDPEPRAGLSSGHIPYSFSLPFTSFLQTFVSPTGASYTTFKPVEELRDALVNAVGKENAQDVLEGKRKIVTSCGSGMTAGVLWLGLRLLGVSKPSLYDEVSLLASFMIAGDLHGACAFLRAFLTVMDGVCGSEHKQDRK